MASAMASAIWGNSLNVIQEDFTHGLNRLKLDDYVGFCLQNNELRQFTENYLEKLIKRNKTNLKSSGVAIDKKNEGNKKYKEKKFEESLALYTESIFHGPQNDETVPLAYSNRSLVLFQMGRYSDCLQDIEMAMSTGYHDSKAWKLKLRKAECLAYLGDFKEARKILIECDKKPHDKRTLQNVKNVITRLECAKDMKVSRNVEFQLPELAGGENENFVSASNYVCAFYSKSKGRHVIATHDIEVGDVLFVEKAFTFVLLKEACHSCCTKTVAPIPCWNCLEVSYCSPLCRDKDWDRIHHLECGYYEALKFLGIAHLSLRIALTASPKFESFKKILNEIREFKYEEGPILWTSRGYEGVYNLITHTEKYKTSALFHFVMSAVLLTLHMKKNTNYFPETSTDEDLILFASVVWRHIMQMICNCYAMVDCFTYTREGKMVVETTEERLGSGVYPSVCLLNHSCEPSVTYSFYKDYFIFRAAKAIKKGEELFSCYGAYSKFMKKSERDEILRTQYFFDCKCHHCLQNFDIQDKFTALKCSKCKGPLIPKGKGNPRIMFCLDCERITEIKPETLEKNDLFYSLLAEGSDLMNKDVRLALRKYLSCWRLAREIFYKFHQDLTFAADQVAMCLAELKDYGKAVMFLKCCLMSVEERFGAYSIEVAGESAKFGDILFNCSLNCITCDENEKRERAREGVKWYERAEKIYSLLYSPHYRDLDEIRENKRKLEAFCAGGDMLPSR